MLSVIMLSVIMLSVIMLSVVAPIRNLPRDYQARVVTLKHPSLF
jgi:hypothetical protein